MSASVWPDGFLAALGAGGILSKVRAEYELKKVRSLKFRFANATRDWINPMELGGRLVGHRLSGAHPFVAEGHRYYLVTAVARTPSISIIAETNGSTGGTVEIGAAHLADAKSTVKVESSGTGEITFAGEQPLAFGVELYELVYNQKRQQLKLKMPEGAIRVRSVYSAAPLVTPAFIGGDDGDIFLRVT